jgi:ABC-type uncharacterized transport system YnjBCD ATPase subunit
MANGDTQAAPQEQQHMYMNKATEYAVSRLIFNIEQAVRDDNNERRWEAYDALRELGIDHMFHRMPDHVQDKGDYLYWKVRTNAIREA